MADSRIPPSASPLPRGRGGRGEGDGAASNPIVVVGAGWSGLACAVELVRLGHRPIVLDAAPAAGGRARSVVHELGAAPLPLDNGQHLLLGAYRDTLALLRTVGVDPAAVLARRPFELAYPDGWRLAAWRAPAPWHLALGILGAHGLDARARWALVRWTQRQRARRWHLAGDHPASELFAGLPAALVRRLWRPLCLAALNVELEEASARVLLAVLRDSLGATAAASELLLPRTDLSALLPDAAARWLQAHGAELRLHTPVLGLAFDPVARGAPALRLRAGSLRAGAVVLALPPARAAALLAGGPPALAACAAELARVPAAPICTTYLRYPPQTRLARPYYTLLDDPEQGHYGQWVFDRGAFDPRLAGVLAVVVSGAGPHLELGREALGARIAGQLASCLGLAAPLAHYTLADRQATIVPAVGLERPSVALPAPGLYLAGDAARSPYPSTLEGSVRSGLLAAQAIGPA
jgi:squalene-associated FAD-dependent desaturase